ncbi:hypothetical protein [Sorangium sp. So ce362]
MTAIDDFPSGADASAARAAHAVLAWAAQVYELATRAGVRG